MSWLDNSNNETGFQVFDGVTYYNLPAGTTGFIRSGLPSHYYMCLQVRSYNNVCFSAWTPWSCTTTY